MARQAEVVERLTWLLAKGDTVEKSREQSSWAQDYPTPDHALFAGWQTQVLVYLTGLLGADHGYTRGFVEATKEVYYTNVTKGISVIWSVREDAEGGHLPNVRELVAAEVFTDFLTMAEHLLSNGYYQPAASLAGAVLEDGLRRMAKASEITVKDTDEISGLAQKLADKGTITRLQQKQITPWKDVRNNADHGKWDEFTATDVRTMLNGVRDFLASHIGA
jgi:hypothetical protein